MMWSAWAELMPIPEAFIVWTLTLALSFWYGYRHPEEF